MNTPPRAETFTPLRTDADVVRRVEQLIEPAARLRQSLWLFFLDENQQQLPVIAPIDDIPDEPDLELVGNLCFIISEVLGDSEPEGSVVLVLTRPGPGVPDSADQAWRDTLSAAAAVHGVRIRMMCLATPEGVAALIGV
jgi:hypothetical protein